MTHKDEDRFWDVLFEPREQTCFTKSIYGTSVLPVSVGRQTTTAQYFSINPLESNRRDDNVIVFRNVLLEFDHGTREEQAKLLYEVPHSTLVWSGGKSHHAIISLETPVKTRAEYDHLVRRIYDKVPGIDKSVKNPSRLTRVPNVMRDNGNMQELLAVNSRCKMDYLESWLGPAKYAARDAGPRKRSLALAPWTRYFLMYGAEEGGRSNSLFKAACDMLRHGYSAEDILERASDVLDLDEQEMRTIIASAIKTVSRE